MHGQQLSAADFHVVTCISNPVRFSSRMSLYRAFEKHMLESGVHLWVVECQYGDHPFEIEMSFDKPNLHVIHVRAETTLWNKENLLNIAINRLPPDVRYVGWFDADVRFARPDWALKTMEVLQDAEVVQPWSIAYDLGPEHDVMGGPFYSFLARLCAGFKIEGTSYGYQHTGYAWAARRDFLDATGGLFDKAIVGSADFHMAFALIGRAADTIFPGDPVAYEQAVLQWQQRACQCYERTGRTLGYVPGLLLHGYHGHKKNRGYLTRRRIIRDHLYDPEVDVVYNVDGVIELAGNKPGLAADLLAYFQARREDG